MITFSNTYRSKQSEIMDDFNLKGEEMKMLLTDLKRVNAWLGGAAITIQGIERLLSQQSKKKEITIVDIGCGDGEMLRYIATWALKEDKNIKLIGIDANQHIIEEAKERSKYYNAIQFEQLDILKKHQELPQFDIALCTLFLHHFRNKEIVTLLQILQKQSSIGVVINDLHRSKMAFQLFKVFSLVFIKTEIARHDGLVSVARGFKKEELQKFSTQLQGRHYIQWKWAFRWQWLINNTKNNNKI